MAGYCLLAAVIASFLMLAAFFQIITEDKERICIKWAAGLTIWFLTYLIFSGLFVTIGWMVSLIK